MQGGGGGIRRFLRVVVSGAQRLAPPQAHLHPLPSAAVLRDHRGSGVGEVRTALGPHRRNPFLLWSNQAERTSGLRRAGARDPVWHCDLEHPLLEPVRPGQVRQGGRLCQLGCGLRPVPRLRQHPGRREGHNSVRRAESTHRSGESTIHGGRHLPAGRPSVGSGRESGQVAA